MKGLPKFKSYLRYRYPLKDKEGTYYGEYTIRYGVKPLGFKGEELVEEIVHFVSPRDEWRVYAR